MQSVTHGMPSLCGLQPQYSQCGGGIVSRAISTSHPELPLGMWLGVPNVNFEHRRAHRMAVVAGVGFAVPLWAWLAVASGTENMIFSYTGPDKSSFYRRHCELSHASRAGHTPGNGSYHINAAGSLLLTEAPKKWGCL